ncbi:Adenylate cyclase [Archangium gephyra]|uniref:Adenylate cyclase n=1 Tax=Archangium gephyra TaxID=48 RepID=A0AAC8Q3H7_9BACT|nr:Adenylate cyclase [Archangium gephyra]
MTQEHLVDSALHRLWGECLRRLERRQEAKYCFLRALAIARQQGAGLFELRATMGLCRLLAERGRPQVARRMLERACPGVQCTGAPGEGLHQEMQSPGLTALWGP